VFDLKDASTVNLVKKAGKAAGKGAAFNALLKSDKILPETRKQKDNAYGDRFVLSTFSSADCSGKATATKEFMACKGPSMEECPKDMWQSGYTCKKTEKPDDMVYSEKWSWGVYDQKFLMRYDTAAKGAHIEPGKMALPETCFKWLDDVQHVFLLQKLNAPSCKPTNSFGAKEKTKGPGKTKGAFLGISGSFRIHKYIAKKKKFDAYEHHKGEVAKTASVKPI